MGEGRRKLSAPRVLCNEHLENSWKEVQQEQEEEEREEEEECVCVCGAHVCFLTFGFI